MSVRNTVVSTIVLVGGALGAIGMRPVTPAAADGTIPYSLDGIIPPSPYHVPAAVAARFCGEYALQPVDRRMRLDSGYIDIARRSSGSLLGLIQIYSYDRQGHLTDWLAVLSNFDPLARGKMAIDLLAESGQELGDHMLLSRTSQGDLIGQLELDGLAYSVRWHRTA